MGKRRRGLLAMAAVIGAVISLLSPTAASAAYYGNEINYTVVILDTPADYGHWYHCTSTGGATACFMPYGEKFFVKDTNADGHSAAASWLFDGPDGYRLGTCVHQHGNGTWGICNKSFPEGWLINFRAAVYEAGNLVGNGAWTGTET
ncbi:hypothetical protein [Phytohabitans aurantiacus]|jgi:hypothetical protein|uniref:Secreted protein n=1 Tax=Phytohabitans aurantiacus TaxID=3016789 RepID=A0ABQ5R377_9ACTN|nr:hypothetical protein [Phytohabitans aurantiacus]GLI00986.1 hypothetical protein Pa4123_62620 [Phytohabitans aurantiacus]